jgi:hypothetical protein
LSGSGWAAQRASSRPAARFPTMRCSVSAARAGGAGARAAEGVAACRGIARSADGKRASTAAMLPAAASGLDASPRVRGRSEPGRAGCVRLRKRHASDRRTDGAAEQRRLKRGRRLASSTG